MSTLAFQLHMPNPPSWNGRWSGENRQHVIVKNLGRSQKAERQAKELDGRVFCHHWDDGWTARIVVHVVDAAEARRLRRVSCGFSGYDWMVESILRDGEIRND